MHHKRALPACLAALADLLGDRLVTSDALREQHGHGEDAYPRVMPDAVAFPLTSEEAAQALAICQAHRIPVVPFGAGTSLEGHVTPVEGGISLDLSRMTRIVEINPEDMDCRVEAGVTRAALNVALRDQGLFFPVDPGSECSIGGMAATRASGTAAVRYGTMREATLGLTVALADGRLIRTGGRARKSSAGYDLTRLFVGSEGTLGVITEVALRLHGIPEAVSAAICQFETLADAVNTAISIMQTGIPVARIELLDEVQAAACAVFSRIETLTARPTLLFEFHGSPAGVAEQAARAQEIASGFDARGFDWATEAEARNRLWRARHDAYWASIALLPGCRAMTTDVVVPISCLAEAVLGAKADILASGFTAPIVGHVGDGNFHCLILIPDAPGALERAWALDRRIVDRALALGGSCTGEHGVGIGKREFLEREHGEGALEVMRSLKAALDPTGILNPGKLLPDPGG